MASSIKPELNDQGYIEALLRCFAVIIRIRKLHNSKEWSERNNGFVTIKSWM